MTETANQSKQYHHPDRLGTRMVTDGSGNVIAENVVLPFGTMLTVGTTLYGDNSYQSTTQTNPSKRFFTSYDRSDTTQLDYAVNRHYNAGHGRFTQVDPQEMGAADLGDPQTLNLYAYCGNDPINGLDPDGLGFLDFLKGLGQAILGFFGINTYGNFSTPPTFPTGGTGVPGLGGSVFGGGGYGGGGYGSLRTPPFHFISVGAGGVGYLTDLGLGIIGSVIRALALSGVSSFVQKREDTYQSNLDRAVKKAEGSLRKRACRRAIAGSSKYGGKNPQQLLGTLKSKGNIQLDPSGSHATLGGGSSGILSVERFLYNPAYKGQAISMGLPANTDIETAQAVEVLHELSHLTGRYSHPQYAPGEEEITAIDLNKKILKACFGG